MARVSFEDGSITNSYATGLVTASSSAGLNNQATGSISVGGLVGTDFGSQNSITNAYFNYQATNQSVGLGISFYNSSNVTAETTASLQAALPAGFNPPSTAAAPTCWGIVPAPDLPVAAVAAGGGFRRGVQHLWRLRGGWRYRVRCRQRHHKVLDDHHGDRQLPVLFWPRSCPRRAPSWWSTRAAA